MRPPRDFNECWECGELNRRSNRRCAMCGAEFDPEWIVVDEPRPAGSDAGTIVLMICVGVVSLGVILAAPGLGILLAILSVVPFLRTLSVVKRRRGQGEPTSFLENAALFLGSLGTTLVVLTVVLVTAVGTFCAVCLSGAIASGSITSGRGSIEAIIAISAIVGLGAAALVSLPMSKWIRHRWRRDVGEDDARRRR